MGSSSSQRRKHSRNSKDWQQTGSPSTATRPAPAAPAGTDGSSLPQAVLCPKPVFVAAAEAAWAYAAGGLIQQHSTRQLGLTSNSKDSPEQVQLAVASKKVLTALCCITWVSNDTFDATLRTFEYPAGSAAANNELVARFQALATGFRLSWAYISPPTISPFTRFHKYYTLVFFHSFASHFSLHPQSLERIRLLASGSCFPGESSHQQLLCNAKDAGSDSELGCAAYR